MEVKKLIGCLMLLCLITLNTIVLANATVTTNEQNLAIESYKKVLQNQAGFFSGLAGCSEKKKKYLHEFLADEAGPGYTFKITQFTVLDMDEDKIPEVVLNLKIGNDDADYREVLHYYNGQVYGYLFGIRSLNTLKIDGTFLGSDGAASTYYSKLQFLEDSCEFETLGYSQAGAHFINNELVTDESFDAFITEQHGKKDAIWYDFSQKNIETVLGCCTFVNRP